MYLTKYIWGLCLYLPARSQSLKLFLFELKVINNCRITLQFFLCARLMMFLCILGHSINNLFSRCGKRCSKSIQSCKVKFGVIIQKHKSREGFLCWLYLQENIQQALTAQGTYLCIGELPCHCFRILSILQRTYLANILEFCSTVGCCCVKTAAFLLRLQLVG